MSVYLLALASPSLSHTVPHQLREIILSLTLMPQDASKIGGTGAPVLVVAWSLQYEMLFYFLFGIIILNRGVGIALSLAIGALVVGSTIVHVGFPWGFVGSKWLLLFAMGVGVAILSNRSIKCEKPLVGAIIGIAAFFIVGLIEVLTNKEALLIDRRFVYGVLSAFIIFFLVQAEDGGRLNFTSKWLTLGGDASYAIYLIHFPLISLCCKIAMHLASRDMAGAVIAFVGIFLICIMAGMVFHINIERPLLRKLNIMFGPSGLR